MGLIVCFNYNQLTPFNANYLNKFTTPLVCFGVLTRSFYYLEPYTFSTATLTLWAPKPVVLSMAAFEWLKFPILVARKLL